MLREGTEKMLDENGTRILLWTNPGSNSPQNSSCMTTYISSHRTIQVRQTNHTMHCWRSKDKLISNVLLLQIDTPYNSKRLTYNSCVQTLCAIRMTCLERWMVGIYWKREKSVLLAWLNDNDNKSCFEFRVFLLLDWLLHDIMRYSLVPKTYGEHSSFFLFGKNIFLS